jgi:Amt family ammonium transporter
MSLAVIGLFVLWLGWFGFNPGSTMSFQNPADVAHILMTTNTAAVAGVLTSTIASWVFIGKPDLGMTINGCLAGLVAVTGSCAYVDVPTSLLIGAIAGVLVVFAVILFDRNKIDDPVGATSVHLVCGVFGTLCVGLFAQKGVTSLSAVDGLFYGGGFGLLGTQLLGVAAVGAFVFASSALTWLAIKKTIGIRVSLEEEIEGLDIGEHGNSAYPDFAPVAQVVSSGNGTAVSTALPTPAPGAVSPEAAVPVVNKARPGAKITKATIIMNQNKFTELHHALDQIGVTGLTVTNVLGHGMQKG